VRRQLLCAAAAALVFVGCREKTEEVQEAQPRPDTLINVQQEAQRVKVGMTEAEVVKILGDPRNRVKESDGRDRLTFWTLDAQKGITARVYVTLDADGKVADVETIQL
jgi:hypothetical protein